MTLACLLGEHDWRPVVITHALVAVCAGCGKESAGWQLTPKPLRFVKPRHRYRWQSYWYQRLGIQRKKVYDKPLMAVRKRA